MMTSTPLDPPSAFGCRVEAQRIVIDDLRLACHIGEGEAERAEAQTLRFDLELQVDAIRPLEDAIHQVVNYHPLIEDIRMLCAERQPRLLETLAEWVLARCMEEDKVRQATVRIRKLELYADAKGVGVEMTWVRDGD